MATKGGWGAARACALALDAQPWNSHTTPQIINTNQRETLGPTDKRGRESRYKRSGQARLSNVASAVATVQRWEAGAARLSQPRLAGRVQQSTALRRAWCGKQLLAQQLLDHQQQDNKQ